MGKIESYCDLQYVDKDKTVTVRLPVQGKDGINILEYKGALSAGPMFYSIDVGYAHVILLPGAPGELEVDGEKYDLSKLPDLSKLLPRDLFVLPED